MEYRSTCTAFVVRDLNPSFNGDQTLEWLFPDERESSTSNMTMSSDRLRLRFDESDAPKSKTDVGLSSVTTLK